MGNCIVNIYRNATYRGFQVEGDSMLPNIRPNEWVLGKAVPSITEASDSKIYIVVLHDSVLVKKLQMESEQIQCIACNENVVDFVKLGQTQHPKLWDYADNIDTIKFLLKL